MVRAAHHAGERTLAEAECPQHFGTVGLVELYRFGFELHAHAEHFDFAGAFRTGWCNFVAHSFFERGDAVEFVFTHVDDGEHAAVGEEEVGRKCLANVGTQPGAIQGETFTERGVGGFECGCFLRNVLIELGNFLRTTKSSLDGFKVGESKFQFDDAQVFEWIGRTGNVVVFEGAQHEHNGVDLTDVGEELVAEAFALARAFDQAADVDDLNRGMNHVLRLGHHGQLIEARVGHLGDADVRVFRGERIGGREGTPTREGVVKRGLARIGEADEAEAFHGLPRVLVVGPKPLKTVGFRSGSGQANCYYGGSGNSPPNHHATQQSTEPPMSTFDLDLSKYQLGWSDSVEYAFAPEKGLNDGVVEQISWWKGEPDWMRKLRLRSLQTFERKPMAKWFADNMPDIDFQDIYYYLRPATEQVDEWDDLPEQMKATYEKLGIPEAERKYLAGVTAQYESEVVFHRNREDLEAQGILFCDMDTALREYPDLVKQYFGTVIPPGDNKFAALNTSVWSGGSFIYVPPGVECEMPLQAYFRINSENAGQFERTLIIADEGSKVHYIEGCSAPVYTSDSLHSAVVEIVVKPSARVTYTTIQNWSPNVYNLVTKRARVEAEGHMEWIDGNIGSKLTMKYPAVYLVGPKATGEVLSVAYAGAGQHQDAGAKMVHAAPETSSKIVSKSISKDGGITTYRGLVRVDEGAYGCKSHVQCDALILDETSESRTLPYMEVGERDAQIGHEATVSKIADEQLFYLQSRGLSQEQAMSMVVNGFIEPVTRTLPMEYAVEWSRLIELQMEGSVG